MLLKYAKNIKVNVRNFKHRDFPWADHLFLLLQYLLLLFCHFFITALLSSGFALNNQFKNHISNHRLLSIALWQLNYNVHPMLYQNISSPNYQVLDFLNQKFSALFHSRSNCIYYKSKYVDVITKNGLLWQNQNNKTAQLIGRGDKFVWCERCRGCQFYKTFVFLVWLVPRVWNIIENSWLRQYWV